MLKMDLIHVIRHKHYQEGLSQRQIARDIGCSRNTVKKYLGQSEPRYNRKKRRAAPIREIARNKILRILDEWEGKTTEKQRVTGSLLYEELLSRNVEVGVSTVRDIYAEIRREKAEVFIPLVHRPGDEAQVDFFEVTVYENGVRRKAWMFLLRLMYSKWDFTWLYDSCDQLAFLDGHVRAFDALDAVPRRVIYDNLTPAVKKVVLGGRILTDAMKRLSRHYVFEPCFARVGRGNDKGGVEARGKGIRWQNLTPIPEGASLQELSEKLLARIQAKFELAKSEDGDLLPALLCKERSELLPLPTERFLVAETKLLSVSKCSTVKIKGVRYSLPSRWARLDVTAFVGISTVEFCCRGLRLMRPRGKRGQPSICYRDYLRELARKPQAVRQVALDLVQELGEPYGELWALLVDSQGAKAGSKVMAKILQAIVDKGEKQVSAALSLALKTKRLHLPSFDICLGERPRIVPVPAALLAYHIESSRATDFDYLLGVGA
jgi:transposase